MNPILTNTLLAIACLLYTYGIVTGVRKGLNWTQIAALAVGLVIDVGTTVLVMAPVMSGPATGTGASPDLLDLIHRLSGAIGLVGMFVILVVAFMTRRTAKWVGWFRRLAWVIYPIWLVSFATGLLEYLAR